MFRIIGWILGLILGFVLIVALVFGAIGLAKWAFAPQVAVANNSNAPVANSPVVSSNVPITAPASDCIKQAEQLGAPEDLVSAICEATPLGNGVSLRLKVGTVVKIGTITFDAEDRVWILQDFTVPQMASYAFEYAGSERSIFDAPFVLGSELGWAKDGSRVPFKFCFNTEGDCTPPTQLFPTK